MREAQQLRETRTRVLLYKEIWLHARRSLEAGMLESGETRRLVLTYTPKLRSYRSLALFMKGERPQ